MSLPREHRHDEDSGLVMISNLLNVWQALHMLTLSTHHPHFTDEETEAQRYMFKSLVQSHTFSQRQRWDLKQALCRQLQHPTEF